MENLGIRGVALEWVKSYLYNRIQAVEIKSLDENGILATNKSEYGVNACGVPQGSVLGPLLFLLYINDLPNAIRHKCMLFADDVSVIIPFRENIAGYESDINQTVGQVIRWLNLNNLNVNLDKTNYIQFGTNRQSKILLNINYMGTKINEVGKTKFLGVTVDKNLAWVHHVDNVRNKLNRYVHVLRRLRHISTIPTSLAAYHGYVVSSLRYGLIIWGNSTNIHKLFIAQKKCVRAICGKGPRDSCVPLFQELGILPLPCLYIYEMATFVRSNIRLFKKTRDVYLRNVRDPDKLVYSTPPRLALYLRQCGQMCVKIYNKLPKLLKTMPNQIFKRKLLIWLKDKQYYSVNDFMNDVNNNT